MALEEGELERRVEEIARNPAAVDHEGVDAEEPVLLEAVEQAEALDLGDPPGAVVAHRVAELVQVPAAQLEDVGVVAAELAEVGGGEEVLRPDRVLRQGRGELAIGPGELEQARMVGAQRLRALLEAAGRRCGSADRPASAARGRPAGWRCARTRAAREPHRGRA